MFSFQIPSFPSNHRITNQFSLKKFYHMQKSLTSYLTFKLDDEIFAANVSKVIEILEIPKITKVPRSPEFMRGVVNLRGNVLSVIDSRTKFGLPPVADTINTCIIVMIVNVDGQDMTMGVIVDAVQEVME